MVLVIHILFFLLEREEVKKKRERAKNEEYLITKLLTSLVFTWDKEKEEDVKNSSSFSYQLSNCKLFRIVEIFFTLLLTWFIVF
jgi:hypothetical protein